jgi:signal transduction histidine kinase
MNRIYFLVASWLVSGSLLVFCSVWIGVLKSKRTAAEAFSKKLLEAQEKERNRIAADLHGSIGQNLLIIKNRADLGLASLEDGTSPSTQLTAISEVCATALDQTRRIAHDLSPRHLQQIGLTEAVDAMIDRVAGSTGIRFDRNLEPVDDLFKGEEAINVYRIVQEALNNVMKHAKATGARVELVRDLRHVELMVRDDGCGFEPANGNGHGRNGGLGMAEIGERVRILGGKLNVSSARGQGTTLSVSIPFASQGKSEQAAGLSVS